MMIIDLHRMVLRQSVKGGNLNTQHSLVLQQSLVFFQSEIQFQIIFKTTVVSLLVFWGATFSLKKKKISSIE